MPTITISLPAAVTELQAEPFERVAGASGQVPQTVSLTGGAGSIVVAATGADWCWKFTECGPGYRKTRYAAVSGDVTYAALVDLDPGTLTASLAPGSSAWEAIAAAASAAVGNKLDRSELPAGINTHFGWVVHTGPKTLAGVIATLDAAEAKGKWTVAYFPPGIYDVGAGLSLSGYSCQIRGAGGSLFGSSTTYGTVFRALTQAGPVMNFTGWATPSNALGRLMHGGFMLVGSNVADATKLNTGLQVGGMASCCIRDITIRNTGGPCLKLAPPAPGNASYFNDYEAIVLHTPVGAKANDVPYLHSIEANGNRFSGIGLRSSTASNDTGVSGAVVVEGSASYPTHDNKFADWWYEFLHVPSGGCLFSLAGNANIIDDFQFFDLSKESGATGTTHFRLLPSQVTDQGGNLIRGQIPGTWTSSPIVVDSGVELRQTGNVVDGVKSYKGGNVILYPGVERSFVHLKGSLSGATDVGWIDNSGQTTNHLIDEPARTELRPAGWTYL